MPKRARKRPENTQMPPAEIARLLKSLDRRVTRIEQLLPTLATKDDLRAFPTADDPKGFATKDDLREEGERSRRHMTVLYEDIIGRLDRHLEGYGHHEERLADHGARLDGHDARLAFLDVRLMAIEKPKPSG